MESKDWSNPGTLVPAILGLIATLITKSLLAKRGNGSTKKTDSHGEVTHEMAEVISDQSDSWQKMLELERAGRIAAEQKWSDCEKARAEEDGRYRAIEHRVKALERSRASSDNKKN